MNKKIILTGGGSAGHVTPNLALVPQLLAEGMEVHYIGTADGIERTIVSKREDVSYHIISSGKLRRYFSWKNFTDPFRVLRGVFQARRIMREVKPALVFSKGGFVSVPVVMAARGKHIPKGVHTGTPIRPELYEGDKERGLSFLGFDGSKPVLLVMGGSLGAAAVNDVVRAALPKLLMTFDVAHLCGKGKVDESFAQPGYRQFAYVNEELPDVFAATTVVVSRAGANAVFEFLALAKPALLIPLPRTASRGDQILNAGYFARKGYAMVLEQEALTPETLLDAVNDLYDRRLSFVATMSAEPLADGTDEVLAVIRNTMRERG